MTTTLNTWNWIDGGAAIRMGFGFGCEAVASGTGRWFVRRDGRVLARGESTGRDLLDKAKASAERACCDLGWMREVTA